MKKKLLLLIISTSLIATSIVGCSSSTGEIPNENENIHVEDNVNLNDAEYASEVFGQEITSIEILADEAEWQTMIDNAENEEYLKVDVVVNGTKFNDVGIRTKGNVSHFMVEASGRDRYSFRLKFDEFVEGQTCFGLDTFVLNNMFGDTTYMKEYVAYDIMKEVGVEAPLFSFADIKLNGETFGLYLAVERYNGSYEERVSGNKDGMLYSVKEPSEGTDTGGSLLYKDDNYLSYPAIFDNVVGSGEEADFSRVIKAMKALSEGENIESYWNVDEILRYFAAHNTVANFDSYSTSKGQNYYLYEKAGKITVLPWDYHLAWGGFDRENPSGIINFPIDTPVTDVTMAQRPLLDKLFSNEEYLEKYHSYLQQIIDNYFLNGKFEAKIKELNNIIEPYVKADPTMFYSYDEYKNAIDAFIEIGELRAYKDSLMELFQVQKRVKWQIQRLLLVAGILQL